MPYDGRVTRSLRQLEALSGLELDTALLRADD